MNGSLFFSKRRMWRLTGSILLLAVLTVVSYGALRVELVGAQPPPPSLEIEAPTQVALGERIELKLIVRHANGIAGYETHLLFDASAAHFSGLHQRQNDLKKLGRDIIPLEVVQLPEGVTIGLASCKFSDCVHPAGKGQPGGAQGTIRIATVLIGTDQEGLLEIALDNTMFVDAEGNPVEVENATPRVFVQVGPENGVSHVAPGSNWPGWPSASPPFNPDVTGDGQVTYADAIEVAIEWTLGREKDQPCGPGNDLSRDVNGDGCINVADVQLVLANTDSAPTFSADSENVDEIASPDALPSASLTFTVNSTSDAGDSNVGDGNCASSAGCTLRAAIQEANAHYGPDTIRFNIPGSGVQTIQLNKRLPSLWDAGGGTTIDGYSQPGARANSDSLVSNAQIMIQIRGNGASAFDAMMVQSGQNRIQGLAIFNVKRAIRFYGSGATDNVLSGSFLGTNAGGAFVASAHVLRASGIEIEVGAAHNQIGGTAAAERNVISGNARHGIDIRSESTDGNIIINNLIGLAPSGDRRLQNLRHGIDINSGPANNVIGGTAAGERNIISGNGALQTSTFTAGVEISHDTLTASNRVIGNCFGTDPACNSAPQWAYNSHYGIRIEDGVNHNVVANNVIGNSREGAIRIDHVGTSFNQLSNNRIGISLNGTAIPNGNFGIHISSSATSNQIGPNNIIANNPVGVRLANINEDYNTITKNSIFNNDFLGIDLGPYWGVNPNDSGDTDTGANEELNWPVLNSATTSTVSGTACAEASVRKPCTIEVFIAERRLTDNGSGNYGQGRTFVGATTTKADGSFTATINGATAGQYLTATATDADGNTSEFSRNFIVASGGTTPAVNLRTGVISSVGSGWTTVTLDRSYNSMVVVASANYNSGKLPAVVRIRNASGNTFDIRVQNPSNSALSGYTVHYMVVEEGVYNQSDHGVKMEAATYTSSVTDHVGSWNGEPRSYANTYNNPVVLGQVMSANDAGWSAFWSRASLASDPPSSSALRLGKHVGEDSDRTRANEVIGYIVIEAGSGSIDGLGYTAALGSNSIAGITNNPPYNYTLSNLSSATAAIISQAGMNGGNGSWALLYGSNPVSTTSLGLAIDEDQVVDSERDHIAEQVAFIVFE